MRSAIRSVVPIRWSLISGSGDNEFTNIDEVSNQIRSADKMIVDGVHFASAVTVVRTADEFD